MAVIAPQPYYAWLRIFINDIDFVLDATGRPQHLISFRHELTTSETGTFELEVFDPTFHGLEMVLWSSYQAENPDSLKVRFQYGFSSPAGEVVASPLFFAHLLKYSPHWTYNGVTITLSGNVLSAKNVRVIDRSYRYMRISDIVRDVAKQAGWKLGRIEDTRPIYVPDDIETSIPTHKTFQACRKPPFTFIVEDLCPYAQREDGKFGYVAVLDDKEDPPVLHFYVPEKKDKLQPTVRTFTIRRSPDEEWVDFSYNIDLTVGELKGLFEWTYADYDPTTGEFVVEKYNVDKDRDKIAFTDQDPLVASGTHGQPNTAQRRDLHAVRYAQERRHAGMSRLVALYRGTFKATLVTVGDPTIKVHPTQFIKILNYLPDGTEHYSSGVYFVDKVVNEIQGGQMTTTYELTRNSVPLRPTHKTKPKETG